MGSQDDCWHPTLVRDFYVEERKARRPRRIGEHGYPLCLDFGGGDALETRTPYWRSPTARLRVPAPRLPPQMERELAVYEMADSAPLPGRLPQGRPGRAGKRRHAATREAAQAESGDGYSRSEERGDGDSRSEGGGGLAGALPVARAGQTRRLRRVMGVLDGLVEKQAREQALEETVCDAIEERAHARLMQARLVQAHT